MKLIGAGGLTVNVTWDFFIKFTDQNSVHTVRSRIYNTEQELLDGFASGEEQAFSTVYAQFYERIYYFTKRYLDSGPDAEDLTADTFVKLWNRRGTFKSLESISIFLYTAARNNCIDFIRHAKMKQSRKDQLLQVITVEEPRDFTLEMIRLELMKLIYAEVEKLPCKMREIFQLSYREGLKPSEIASRLQLSVQTVSNQKTTAIKLIRMALSEKSILFPAGGGSAQYFELLPFLVTAEFFFYS